MTKAEEIYHKFVNYECNEVGNGLKDSIIKAIDEALKNGQKLPIYNISNCSTCSGCNQPKPTVKRHMFDGMCADCRDKALYDYDFAIKVENRNNELMRHCC